MPEDDQKRPPRMPTPGTHAPRLHTFDDDPDASGPSARKLWVRHPVAVVLLLAALVVALVYVYLGIVRGSSSASPPPEEEPTEPAAVVPTTVGGPEFRDGLTALPGPELSGPVGSAQALTVRAMGPGGLPLADRWVRFQVVEGTGTLEADSVQTDEAGLARTSLSLPEHPERLLVVATLGDPELSDARFTVVAHAGVPARAVIAAGDGQSAPGGELLPQRLGVLVTDQHGNPVPDVAVNFQVVSGGGLVAPSRARTDSMGHASAVWRLGRSPGSQLVVAMSPEADARLDFNAIAEGDTAMAAASDSSAQGAVDVLRGGAAVAVVARPFSVGGSFVCAIPGGILSCRGANDRGQRAGGSTTRFVAVASGVSHACSLTFTGAAFCWGANESGQLGDGSRTDRAAPVSVDTDVLFFTLAAGASHTCGLIAGGHALCWGGNLNGQLGDGSREDRVRPGPVSGPGRFATVEAGWNHTCAVTVANQAYCWGLNDHGQLGDGSRIDHLTPTRVPGTFESVAAGSAHTCGVHDGEVFCWGSNAFGQLGDGSTRDRPTPAPVQGLPGSVSRLAAGAVSTCALLTDGTAWCWGQNLHGQVGDGTNENRTAPTAVAGDHSFASISAGGALTCAFTVGGAQYCWGLNQSGQLGDGTRVSRSVPTRVTVR